MPDSHYVKVLKMSNRVYVKSGDSKIWNVEVATAEIVHTLAKHGHVVIDFQWEAPDIATTELKNVLDYLSSQGVTHDQIEIHTGNIIESYNKFKVVKQNQWMYELLLFQRLRNCIAKQKQIKKHFGCFIGRSNTTRLIMASHLSANYPDKTLLTYHFRPGDDFHRVHLGLENIIYYFGVNSVEYREAIALLDRGPILIGNKKTYPITLEDGIIEPCAWYKDIFVDLVCETFSNGNVFFVTEKFWRSVATKTPFIIQGPKFFIKRLKQLGFQTFDRWWSEGYDEHPYLYSQNEIKKILIDLSKLNTADLETIYAEMQPILEHNYNLMMSLRFEDFDVVH